MKYKLLLLAISSAFAIVQGGDPKGSIHIGPGGDKANYKFEYGVQDPQTNDYKSQYEYRDGDYVVGAYEVKEADGTKRIVKYRSAPDTGFQAVVEKVGTASHPPSGPSKETKGGFGSYSNHLGGLGGFGGYSGLGGLGYMGFGGLKSDYSGFKSGFGNFGGVGANSYVGPTHWGSQGHRGYAGHGFGGFGGLFGGHGGFLNKL